MSIEEMIFLNQLIRSYGHVPYPGAMPVVEMLDREAEKAKVELRRYADK